jgi:hypothetical protein
MANQYLPPLHQLLRQPSIKPLVSDKPEDPRSNLEEFIKKFYPDSLDDKQRTDLKLQLKESRLPNGDTDFSKISLDNLRFLNLQFVTLPQFEYSNPSETLNYSIKHSTFTRDIQTEIGVKDKAFRLKEQAKQTLTNKLQKLSLDDIRNKLEDFRNKDVAQNKTTDDDFEEFKFDSTKAQTQISTILTARQDLTKLADNKEIQQFYFKELKIIQQQKQQELKEQAKQVLTDELQKLSLDDIRNKLEDFKNKDVEQNKTTDDDFEEFKFDSTKAQTQISEILTARQDLTKLADDNEFQQFYFYELQEIEFEKEEESKKLQTQKTQSSTNYIKPQSLKKSSSSSFFSSPYKEKTTPDGIKNTTKRAKSLPNISSTQTLERSVKKTTSTRQNNIYSEQHPSSDFKKNQEFRNFFKPTLVDKITSAVLWLFESSSPPQGPEIIGPAMKAYKKFGSNPDEAENFASFLDIKFTVEKHQNKSLTFDDFIKKQNVDSLLNEFEKTKSQFGYQEFGSSPAISATRRARSLTNTNSNNTGQAQTKGPRSKSFLTPGQSNTSDGELNRAGIFGNQFKSSSFNDLSDRGKEIFRKYVDFKNTCGAYGNKKLVNAKATDLFNNIILASKDTSYGTSITELDRRVVNAVLEEMVTKHGFSRGNTKFSEAKNSFGINDGSSSVLGARGDILDLLIMKRRGEEGGRGGGGGGGGRRR